MVHSPIHPLTYLPMQSGEQVYYMKRAYQNLGEFISELERAGELLRIKAPVSSDLEITHITDLASKAREAAKPCCSKM